MKYLTGLTVWPPDNVGSYSGLMVLSEDKLEEGGHETVVTVVKYLTCLTVWSMDNVGFYNGIMVLSEDNLEEGRQETGIRLSTQATQTYQM